MRQQQVGARQIAGIDSQPHGVRQPGGQVVYLLGQVVTAFRQADLPQQLPHQPRHFVTQCALEFGGIGGGLLGQVLAGRFLAPHPQRHLDAGLDLLDAAVAAQGVVDVLGVQLRITGHPAVAAPFEGAGFFLHGARHGQLGVNLGGDVDQLLKV
nr:hypothetical protein [Methylogaea oryzae]